MYIQFYFSQGVHSIGKVSLHIAQAFSKTYILLRISESRQLYKGGYFKQSLYQDLIEEKQIKKEEKLLVKMDTSKKKKKTVACWE